jgi:hypothetical protein
MKSKDDRSEDGSDQEGKFFYVHVNCKIKNLTSSIQHLYQFRIIPFFKNIIAFVFNPRNFLI